MRGGGPDGAPQLGGLRRVAVPLADLDGLPEVDGEAPAAEGAVALDDVEDVDAARRDRLLGRLTGRRCSLDGGVAAAPELAGAGDDGAQPRQLDRHRPVVAAERLDLAVDGLQDAPGGIAVEGPAGGDLERDLFDFLGHAAVSMARRVGRRSHSTIGSVRDGERGDCNFIERA